MPPTTLLARAPAATQLPLLHVTPTWDTSKNAVSRNTFGTLAQDIACVALGLRAIPIDGRCAICFDAEDKAGRFYEIKSVRGNGGKLVVYDWRMEKEAAFPDLAYVLAVHRVPSTRKPDADLFTLYTRALELRVVPATAVHAAAKQQPLRKLFKLALDPRNGYTRAGYNRGYRNVPLTSLPTSTLPHPLPLTFAVHGRQVSATVVWCI